MELVEVAKSERLIDLRLVPEGAQGVEQLDAVTGYQLQVAQH